MKYKRSVKRRDIFRLFGLRRHHDIVIVSHGMIKYRSLHRFDIEYFDWNRFNSLYDTVKIHFKQTYINWKRKYGGWK